MSPGGDTGRGAAHARARMLWRDRAAIEALDLAGRDFEAEDWTDALFIDCDLSGVRLGRAGLDGAQFLDCVLRGSDWRGATTRDLLLHGCDLDAALLQEGRHQRLRIVGSDLQGSRRRWRTAASSASTWAARAGITRGPGAASGSAAAGPAARSTTPTGAIA